MEEDKRALENSFMQPGGQDMYRPDIRNDGCFLHVNNTLSKRLVQHAYAISVNNHIEIGGIGDKTAGNCYNRNIPK